MEIIELNYSAKPKPKFKGIFQPPDKKNGGGRMYPTDVLSSNIKFLKEAAELEKRWEKNGLLDLIISKVPPGGHWLDGQRLTNEPHEEYEYK